MDWRILFVDDETDMEELIRQRFRRQVREQNLILEFAGNGLIALEKIKQFEDIHIVVTDINMPVMDGLKLLSEIALIDRPIRSLVVSAYGDMLNIRTAMNNGAFDFITKPIDFSDLEITLEKTKQDLVSSLNAIEIKKELQEETQKRIIAQEEAIKHAQENATLIKMQNLQLEERVQERTLQLAEKNEKLNEELQRSDLLLLNILPFETAQELKQFGVVKARFYSDVTVMFTDFKGFTTIAENLEPGLLVELIDDYFRGFDLIMEKYGIEKIKTIGDAYMAASGLPIYKDSHAVEMVKAAKEILEFMNEQRTKRIPLNLPVFDIRIGIHTGPVVAGIVGHKKFVYDIWGDAVNVAARMESSGEIGKINISQTTCDRIKDTFTSSYRGEIEVKNKGKIRMFFIN
jgi:class 3 adenylate cyclase/FixJ family two-component response regulator